MKKLLLISIMICIVLSAGACSAPEKPKDEPVPEIEAGTITDEETGAEYSNNILIVSVSEEADPDAVKAVFEKYNMQVIYDMPNLSMYSVQLERPATAEQIDELISKLEAEENILGVNRDYIAQLD